MSEYYGVQRSSEYLSHYGIKGMKWGVRKAQYYGNSKALERHYRKAAKKLAKLEDIGNNPKKYAARAAAYGAAAAGTGTLAGHFGVPKAHPVWEAIKPDNDVDLYQIWRKTPLNKNVANVAGAATVGLGAAAGVNAYRAANSKRYRKKAAQFRSAMNEAFKGTKYEG